MFNIFKKYLSKNKKLEGIEDIPRWHVDKCYECGNDVSSTECWHQFVEISGKQYAVPICDDCNTVTIFEEPTNL